ncbi:hypothetical protein R1flu_009041 [Riccia fluitans]|uniref:Uncharacterized protein n=1 Tax=Riccia fluitans TaxID=41844 RepID=A0ABD1Z245_9MARC
MESEQSYFELGFWPLTDGFIYIQGGKWSAAFGVLKASSKGVLVFLQYYVLEGGKLTPLEAYEYRIKPPNISFPETWNSMWSVSSIFYSL